MKNKLKKDKIIRLQIQKNIINNLIYKKLLSSNQLDKKKKFKIFLLCLKNKKYETTRYKNLCMYTGKSRGIIKNFRLNRQLLKKKINEGYFPGIQKSSW